MEEKDDEMYSLPAADGGEDENKNTTTPGSYFYENFREDGFQEYEGHPEDAPDVRAAFEREGNFVPGTRLWSVLSFVCGVVSLALCWLGFWAILPGALGLVFAVFSRIKLGYFDGLCLAGLIVSICGVVIGGCVGICRVLLPGVLENLFRQYGGDFSDGDINHNI